MPTLHLCRSGRGYWTFMWGRPRIRPQEFPPEEVDITYADNTIIPTLISAQYTVIDGVSFDVEVIIDVSARVRQQREIESALKTSARTDALSGLPNRARFDEIVAEAVARNLVNDRKLTLA